MANEREEGSAVHICADAQTGLGTTLPRPFLREHWYGNDCLASCRKRRLLENSIMGNMLTATYTFDTEIDGIKSNIYTCCCNGRHEPQQIDHILSSDRCLRSKMFDSPATKSDHWGLTATTQISICEGNTSAGTKETNWVAMQ